MMGGVRIDLGSFLACQLFSATTNTKGRIVIGGVMTSIARFFGAERNLDDQVSRFERLEKAVF